MTAGQSVAERAAALGGLVGRHAVVTFRRLPLVEERRELQRLGLAVLALLSADSALVRIANHATAEALAAHPLLLRAAPLTRAHKLHPLIQRGELPEWARVTARPPGDEIVALIMVYHRDETAGDAIWAAQAHGAVVVAELRAAPMIVIELPAKNIPALADEDCVQWLETPLPRLTELNAENRALSGADVTQAAPLSLDGTGVNVLVFDSGRALATHPDFEARCIALDDAPVVDHSTHVTGTLAGSGAAGFGVQRGLAPGVSVLSAAYQFSSAAGVILYDNPGDLEYDYAAALEHPTHPADLASNSLGSNIELNHYPCALQGDYGATDQLLDAIVLGGLGRPLPIVWAGGNERLGVRCNSEGFDAYYSIAPPAGAKNPLVVGAVNANDDSMTLFSGWGPTDDGRLKPDVVAPGCQTGGDWGVTSCSASGGYSVRCGTSMATPTVAGIAALLLEQQRRTRPQEPELSNAGIKALLAHTAVDRGRPGPDYQFGYGSVRVQPALAVLAAGGVHEGQVDQGQAWTGSAYVPPGTSRLSITLAWDDPPGVPNVTPALVHDLDLVVHDPANAQWFPWTLNPLTPDAAATRGQPDRRNNLEQVVVDNPPAGVFEIQVQGFAVPLGPQRFALVATPEFTRCQPSASVAADRRVAGCAQALSVQVVDCDLNTNGGEIELATAHAASGMQPEGVEVILTETFAASGVFRGTLNLSDEAASGTLQVAHADAVTITYVDADNGAGQINLPVVDLVAVDCAAPQLSNVVVERTSASGAEIRFDADEPVSAGVLHGATCGSPLFSATAPGRHTACRVFVSQLPADAERHFRVTAVDAAGNRSEIGAADGGCFTLRTRAIADAFTELFQAEDNDLNSRALLLEPDGSFGAYRACGSLIFALPTAPPGGSPLILEDNASAFVPAAPPVLLYGREYDGFWVNANGTLTFDGPDAHATPSLAGHFARPRISGLWYDFDPGSEGAVSWKQTSDRIAVTWENVVDAGLSSNSTFQIELFFDGRIRLSWLDAAVLGGLAGISPGAGGPAEFAESDLSSYASCGPRPPSASGRRRIAAAGAATRLQLPAADEGMTPLELTIDSAPMGELRSLGGARISAANLPYTLPAGEDAVWYFAATPGVTDAFTYHALDGGQPPTGGSSNAATVEVETGAPLVPPIADSFETVDLDPLIWAQPSTATIDDRGLSPPTPPLSARLNGDPHGGDVLTTRLVDLGQATSALVTYAWQRRGAGDSPETGDDLVVYYRAADGTWRELARHAGAGADMTTFAVAQHPVPADGLHRAFALRFVSHANQAGLVDDWFIDDVLISATPRPRVPGDLDCDGVLTNFDIDPFVLALIDPAGYAIAHPECAPLRGDCNADDRLDNFDIDPFVACLVVGCPPP